MSTEWKVYDYEVEMFNATYALCKSDSRAWFSRHLNNAIVESLLLHTRILVDILLSRNEKKNPDEVTLKSLLHKFESPQLLKKLADAYREGTEDDSSPWWTINKRLAHPTNVRTEGHDYNSMMATLQPIIESLLKEIEIERNRDEKTKRPKALSFGPTLTAISLTTSSS
jgi:hypothetical protein